MLVLDFAGLGLGLSSCLNNSISDSLSAPVNSINPVISGANNIGRVLTTTNGTWTGSPTFTYQWYRGVSAISGQTASTYTIQYLDLYDTASSITCEVTATNAAGTDTAISNGITPAVLSFVFLVDTTNTSIGSSTSTQFKLPLTTSSGLAIVVNWGDGQIDVITNHTSALCTHTYAAPGIYEIGIKGSLVGWRFGNAGDRLKIMDIASWGALNITVNAAFRGCSNLICSATDAPKRTGINLGLMFQSCTNFNGKISNWYTTGVANMNNMFSGAAAFDRDLGNWDMSTVTNLQNTFFNATAFNNGGSSSIGDWDTGAVTNLNSTFDGATAFNQDISDWDIGTDIGAAVTVFTSFMSNKSGGDALSTANYDAILDMSTGWPSQGGISSGESISFSGAQYTPGNVDSGTTTSTAANKLIQTGQNFLSTVNVGDIVRRTAAGTYAEVTAVDSDTQLSLSSDLMTTSPLAYTIEGSNAAKGRFKLLTTNTWTIGDGGPA
jgi:hypothetical protein